MDRIEGGKHRFKTRVARLNRLVELDAPVSLLAREVTTVLDALYLIDAEAVGHALADCHQERVRRSAGYCVLSDCVEQAINRGVDGNDLCAAHNKEALETGKALDAMADATEDRDDQ